MNEPQKFLMQSGLGYCLSIWLPAVEVELDAKLVVDLLEKENSGLNGNVVLVADCKDRLKQIPRVRILHCFREANMCADALARRGAQLTDDFAILSSPPLDVLLLVNLDAVGIVYERFCSHVTGF
ncbi:hypothetical protein SO802_022564 [Lithocarpus litseifolius]|uniref:RNase H type-1 domain-containing protein n=1 Tax=Lithocarpus litseifolius TaxID=425828 RepID=A0AAW2C5A5_9ROSI